MNWINNVFYMGLLTALTGSIAFGVYAAVSGVLDACGKYRFIYRLLLWVFPFWLFPLLYLGLYATHYQKVGAAWFIKGHLFELTPAIARVEQVAAVLWLLGALTAVVSHGINCNRVEWYLKKHRIPAEKQVQLAAVGIQARLHIRGNVQVYRCYGIESPMVLGVFHKWIALPVQQLSPESLQIVLTHELVHVHQHILEYKCLGRVLEDLFWYDPLIYQFNRRLDFWSEMACDIKCCGSRLFSTGQYFRTALELLTQQKDPQAIPFSRFGAQNTLEARIQRMKQYRQQNELKRPGAFASVLVVWAGSICLTCGAGFGAQKAIQTIYAQTVEKEVQPLQNEVSVDSFCYATEIEGNSAAGHSYMVREEPFDAYKQAVMDAFPEDITADSINLSAQIPNGTLCRWTVTGTPQKIRLTVSPDQPEQMICVGILTSSQKRIYVEANGQIEQVFETTGKDTIESVFVENTGGDTVTVSGIATAET